MKKLVIYGVAYPDVVKIVDAINAIRPQWEILGFIEDREDYKSVNVLGYHVLGDYSVIPKLAKEDETYFFNNHYGHYADFKERNDFLIKNNCKFASLIHPSIDLNYVKIGRGCLIADGCCLGSNIEIGDYVTIRGQAIVSHDTKIENYVMIAPGSNVGSCVTLKEGVFLGSGSVIKRTITVGKGSTVGCGAVVIKNVGPNITVAGIPAKKIKKNIYKKIINKLKSSFPSNCVKQPKCKDELKYEKTHN